MQDNALFLQASFKNLASFLQDFKGSCKILARFALFLQVSCKNCLELSLFLYRTKHIKYLSKLCVFLHKNVVRIQHLEPRFLLQFRKWQWSYPNGRDKVTVEDNCFTLYSCSDKLSHYKTYVFRKFLIPNAFKDVRLQNTFNRCKFHQILPLTVDYACFLVKCINHQNLMCIQMIYFLQDLAGFLQEPQCIQESCKNWTFL